MIRYLRLVFLVLFGLCLITVAMANRQAVSLKLLPDELAGILGLGYQTEVPLFIVIFGGIVVGILVGFVWEWLREFRLRSDGARERKERQRLQRELAGMKKTGDDDKDEVLALLEGRG